MQKNTQRRRMVRVSVNGAQGSINAAQLTDLTKHHGTTKGGIKVSSPSTQLVGDTVVFQRSDDSFTSIAASDFEIAAKGYLKDLGYSVKA